jgi:hypothetical protein
MIVVYAPMSEQQLRKSASENIPKIEEWFKANPKRRVCRVELWYGEVISIKRKTVAEQINARMEKLIGEGRIKK